MFFRRGGYSNVNGWKSKLILINKINSTNQISMIFYSEDEKPIMTYSVVLEPLEIKKIELDFEELRDHFGKIDLEGEEMFDGSVATFKGENCIDLRLAKLDADCPIC